MRKNNMYTNEFKEMVVKEYLSGSESAVTIAKKYNIRNSSQVKHWKNQWREYGCFPDGRGKSSKGKVGRPRTIKREEMTDNEYIEYLEMQFEIKKYLAFYEKRKQ